MAYLIEAEWRIYASVNKAIIGSDDGLSPVRRQAIICTNDHLLFIGPLRTKFSGIIIENETFSLTKLHLKTSSAQEAAILSRPQWVEITSHRTKPKSGCTVLHQIKESID